jgi:hypothetical protein
LFFAADKEWEKLSFNPPHPAAVLFLSLLPLIIAMLAVEAWGLSRFGQIHGELGAIRIPAERAIKYTVFYGAASILVILFGAGLLRNVGPSFNLDSSFGHWFILIAYGYAPLILLRVLDAFPRIKTWICWGIGSML